MSGPTPAPTGGPPHGPAVLITGASSGIGRTCAEHLTDRGFLVVGASRRTTPDVPWPQVVMDVDDDTSTVDGVHQVVRDHGGIDAVVTCAGWGLAGSVEQTPIADARAQMETNFFGTVRTVQAALPTLRERRGRIVLMSSIGGVIGLPFQAYYSAGKFALEGWAEALAWEVKPFGIGLTLVQPGNFRTGFTGSRRTIAVIGDDPYAAAAAMAIGKMERDELGGSDPKAVAEVVAKVLTTARPPRRLSVGPAGERVGVLAKRLLPHRLFEAASASSLGV
jgi:NAD(P)-dependent dehydrogenase (short-subunit alcohol dehydrogenase family)